MNMRAKGGGRVTISAVVTRADGSVEDWGEVHHSNPADRRQYVLAHPEVIAEPDQVENEEMVSQVQNTGLADFVSALVTANTIKFIGWGTGSAAAVTATDLTTPAAESRTSGTISSQTTTTTGDTYRVTGAITATGVRAITEVGVFTLATTAVLRIYGDFTVINLAINDSITFTIDTVLDQA